LQPTRKMIKLNIGIYLSLVIITIVYAGKITNLPGLTFTPTFNQYAGYITVNATHGRALHYWFVESQNDPTTDPLVLWLQGGPGCSSLLGLLTENGPFVVQPDLTVTLNPYSWNRIANMLYVEAPAGVGFSYSNTTSDYTTGDNQTRIDNLNFLLGWFAQFPQFANNDFYISGESYGGHYVPQLAWTIIEAKTNINLKGFFVGNAWTDDVIDSDSVPPFMYYHGLCSRSTWDSIVANCNLVGTEKSHIRTEPFYEGQTKRLYGATPACDEDIRAMYQETGNLINQYDIYTPCIEGGGLGCMNYTKETDWLNTPAVQQAIYANTNLPAWSVCTSNLNYNEQWASVVPIYPTLMLKLRVTVYTGDVTYNVPFLGSEVWIDDLKAPIKDAWKAWYFEEGDIGKQVGGYIKKYVGINIATVIDAGHMVPAYQPASAFVLFTNFLNGTA